jgi:hypothetical protein
MHNRIHPAQQFDGVIGMDQAERVTVFNYRVFDFRSGETRLAKYKAPREVIAGLRGQVLEGTDEEVSRADLDERGRFRRVPVGWDEVR